MREPVALQGVEEARHAELIRVVSIEYGPDALAEEIEPVPPRPATAWPVGCFTVRGAGSCQGDRARQSAPVVMHLTAPATDAGTGNTGARTPMSGFNDSDSKAGQAPNWNRQASHGGGPGARGGQSNNINAIAGNSNANSNASMAGDSPGPPLAVNHKRPRLDSLGTNRLTVSTVPDPNRRSETKGSVPDGDGNARAAKRPQQVMLGVRFNARQVQFVGQHLGEYGHRNALRKQLRHMFRPLTIDQDTHEAEHVIGYAVLAPEMPRPNTSAYKEESAPNKRLARQVENQAPAYHEVNRLHRDHPGTGSSGDGNRYRAEQRAALLGARQPVTPDESGWSRPQDPPVKYPYSNAVQLNQLEYAHMLRQKSLAELAAMKGHLEVANSSFLVMVANVNSVTYLTKDNQRGSVNVHCVEKCEQELARIAVVEGRWPTLAEENAVRTRYGVPTFFELRDGAGSTAEETKGETKDSDSTPVEGKSSSDGDTTMTT
jgi:hypothetical protein